MLATLADRVGARLHWWFLLIAGGFGLALVWITPPNGSSDEISHQFKTFRVAAGDLFGADQTLLLPDIPAWHGAFGDAAMLDPHRRFSRAELRQALSAPLACAGVTHVANDSVASYGPLPYLAPALALRTSCRAGANYGTYLHAARIAGLVVALGLVGAGIALAGSGRWMLFSAGTLPDTVGQLVAISADGMLFGLAIALVGTVSAIAAGRLQPRPGLALLVLAAMAISLTKPGYFWIAWAALATLPVYRAAGWRWMRLALLLLALPVLVQAGLVWLSRGGLPVVPGVDPAQQARLLLADPLHLLAMLSRVPAAQPIGTQWSLLETLVGLPVWMDTRLPLWLTAALCGGLALSLGMDPDRGLAARARLFLAALAGGSLVLVALPLYLFATQTGNSAVGGVQGRYLIPSLLLLLAAGRCRLPASVRGVGAIVLLALPCLALSRTLALVHARYLGH